VWPGSAGYGLTWRLAAVAMAGYGLVWPGACGRWLPVWLPEHLVSNANVRNGRTLVRTANTVQ